MKEKLYPNTGLKAFIKQSSVYKQQEDIFRLSIYGNYFQYFSSQLYSIFQPTFILNNNDCCIESLSVDSCSSLHLQALKESAISKQLTICPKIKNLVSKFC
jgi:hypothetical protein